MSTKKTTATKIISERLQLLIDETGMKKGKLAAKVGITPGAISQILSGKSGASAQTIKSLANEFEVNEEWLEFGTGEKEKKFEVTELIEPETKKTEQENHLADQLLSIACKLSPESLGELNKKAIDLLIAELTAKKS